MLERKVQARQFFDQALRHADVRQAVLRNFRIEGSQLLSAGTSFNLPKIQDIILIAIGKAATPMYEAVVHVLRNAAWPPQRLVSVVVSPQSPAEPFGTLLFFQGSHPIPSEGSRVAAITILEQLRSTTSDTLVLFLISGGSSAMVELPLDSTISASDVASFNRILVGSGLPINEINSLRKHLSAIKGGRLAEAAAPAAQCTLIISDVPASLLDTVGSGPSLPDTSSKVECSDIYRHLRAAERLPLPIERFFESGLASETPKQTDPAFAKAAWTCVLSSEDLASGAADAAAQAGFHVEIDNCCDEWAAEDAAQYLLSRSAQLSRHHERTCLISAGELRVKLSQTSGRGGRNQHFALQCALSLAGDARESAVLSAGSDGVDGNSPAAGAIADENTCREALLRDIDPVETLKRFDSFRLFNALGDTITIGPTGNNLRDLRLLLT